MKTHDQCCSHDCAQGRTCPRRAERRAGPATFWRRFWQLLREKRDGFDRRGRMDMAGLPVMNSASSAKNAQTIGTPEFHRLLQQVCEVEMVLAAAGSTPAIYDAFESASNARKALIAYIDARQSAAAQLLQALRDGIPLQEPVHIGKALLAQREARVVLDNGIGPVAAVHLVNIGLTGWIYTKETAEAYATGYNAALKQYRATLLKFANLHWPNVPAIVGAVQQSTAERDVLAERRRQIDNEGWEPEYDDKYQNEELRRAAASYVLHNDPTHLPALWPWPAKWWKPRDRRSNLVRAGALILAEIERIDRAAAKKDGAA